MNNDIPAVPARPIGVLGMHRSGTSSLTGLMEDAGVWMGEILRENPHNLKGNRERRAIMVLHNSVLEDNGAKWNQPPEGYCHWGEQRKDALRDIIDGYPKDRVWGFKDPRTVFTIDAWLELVPEMRYIGTFRHPVSVAQSLHHRNRMPVEEGIALWIRYNTKLLALKERLGFELVCFDRSAEDYLAQVAVAFRKLGLSFSDQALGFFEEKYRNQAHHQSSTPPDQANDLYQRLLASIDG